jgi:hypothetical protein
MNGVLSNDAMPASAAPAESPAELHPVMDLSRDLIDVHGGQQGPMGTSGQQVHMTPGGRGNPRLAQPAPEAVLAAVLLSGSCSPNAVLTLRDSTVV